MSVASQGLQNKGGLIGPPRYLEVSLRAGRDRVNHGKSLQNLVFPIPIKIKESTYFLTLSLPSRRETSKCQRGPIRPHSL